MIVEKPTDKEDALNKTYFSPFISIHPFNELDENSSKYLPIVSSV
jgi:hypothetical protein